MLRTLATLSLIAATAACTSPPEREPEIRAPAASVTGEPVSCISTTRLRETRVHDDYTIDFHMTDGKVYRNTMAHRCAGLGFEERFGYQTTISQLCNTDTITVLHSGGGVPGPTCGLEKFVPVKLDKPNG